MQPFRNSEAERLGISSKVLRGPAFSHPASGVSMLAVTARSLPDVCRAVALVLPPGSVFTHVTAARLRGWWMPNLQEWPLVACTSGEAPHLDRRGVYIRRCAIPLAHRESWNGIPIASAAWTIVELAEHLSLIDLVVVIDGALHLRHVTEQDIRAAMRPGRRGVRVLRQALGLVDARSESPWESILRILHAMSGVPVHPQVRLLDDAGQVFARADLLIEGTRRLAEYDGADHRDRSQHQRDLARDKRLARERYERYGYIASEILRSPELIVADAFEALGRPRSEASVRLWRELAAVSSLTEAGRAALVRRLRRFARTTGPRASGASQGSSGAESPSGAP